jgi:acyl-CoA synthetase (AMP-forming)/AMP-acid ligase II
VCRRSTSRPEPSRRAERQGRFPSIRICFSGAAPLLADTRPLRSITGGHVEGYSLTEAMMALCVNPVKGPNKLGSVGMPLPDVSVRIFDADAGTRGWRRPRSARWRFPRRS